MTPTYTPGQTSQYDAHEAGQHEVLDPVDTFLDWTLDDREIGQALAPLEYKHGTLGFGRIGRGHTDGLVPPARQVPEFGQPREVDAPLDGLDRNLARLFAAPEEPTEYDNLAVTLMLAAQEKGVKRVLVASPQRCDGRTSVALGLARALALAGRRVAVVEGDLRRPSIMRKLGLACEGGLGEVLAAGGSPGDALVSVSPFGFHILPAPQGRAGAALALAASSSFGLVVEALDRQYDFVLFDSPPLLDAGDACVLARYADTVLLVVRPGSTSTAQMERAIAPLRRDDVLGVVFNRVRN